MVEVYGMWFIVLHVKSVGAPCKYTTPSGPHGNGKTPTAFNAQIRQTFSMPPAVSWQSTIITPLKQCLSSLSKPRYVLQAQTLTLDAAFPLALYLKTVLAFRANLGMNNDAYGTGKY
jgi:hypothetical protein